MKPWLRLLAAAGGVVVVALLLKLLPPIIVLALIVGGVAFVNARLKPTSARTRPSVAEARVLGLERSATDPFGLLGYPLSLFSRGHDGQIVDVLWGSWRRLDVKVFEYRSAHGGPGDGAATRRYACALGPAPAEWAPLSVEPEAFLTPVSERSPLRTVQIGVASFDDRFDVRCDDEAVARQFLDPGVQEWMLVSDSWGFEVNGRLVLAYRPVDGPVPTTEALEALGGFLERIPMTAQPGERP